MLDPQLQSVQFLAALFGPYSGSDLRCELRSLPRPSACDAKPARGWFPLTDNAIATAANVAVNQGAEWNVYCGVLPRMGRRGGTNDTYGAGWLYADIDGGNQGPDGSMELLRRADIPQPHMTVVSGGGVHCYWRLAEVVEFHSAEDRFNFKITLKRIVMVIGGSSPGPHADPSAAEPARILRIPGTWNHKDEANPRSVELTHFDAELPVYSLAEWNDRLPFLPKPKPSSYHNVVPSGLTTPGLIRWAQTGYPEGNRHKDLTAAAAWLVRDCRLSKGEAEELLRLKAARSNGARAITEDEIQHMISWA